jgi:hypothetical protein
MYFFKDFWNEENVIAMEILKTSGFIKSEKLCPLEYYDAQAIQV